MSIKRSVRLVAAASVQSLVLFVVLGASSARANSFLPATNGDLYIEAENHDANVSQRGRSWIPEFRSGYVGNGAMRAMPNNDVRVTKNISANSPRMDYRVDYPSRRTVKIWLRAFGPNGASNSVWVGIDGDSANAIRINTVRGAWGWATSNERLVVPAGAHTINIWMREDGTIVDRLHLTPSSKRPRGNGRSESPRGGAGQDSRSNTWPIANDDTFDIVNDGTSHALAVLADNGNGADFDSDGDTINIVSVEGSGSAGSAVSINASSDGLFYTPAVDQVGSETFDYTIADGNGGTASATVTVSVNATDPDDSDLPDPPVGGDGGSAFLPDGGGRVTIEAENHVANVSKRSRRWVPAFRSGYVGNSAMQAIPNNNVRVTSNISANSPRMDYRVNYPSRRTVKIWLRAYGLNGNSNSVWVGIDGDNANAIRINTARGAWGWATSNERLVVPAGAHTINIWMREDGTVVDRFHLSPSATRPSGNGPAESRRNGSSSDDPPLTNNAPTISGAPPTTATVGALYSFTPTSRDVDGQPLTFSSPDLPQWLTIDSATGRISGTPEESDVGSYDNIEIVVTDGQERASLALPTISVTSATNAVGSVTLSWTAPTRNDDGSYLTDLAGYRIRWGTRPGRYPNSVTIDNAGITTYVVEGLVPGSYEFVARSINSAGVESRDSNPTKRTVP